MRTYYEREYRKSRSYRHHHKKRRARKVGLVVLLLGVLCLVIALFGLPVGLWLGTPATRSKWFMFSAVYAGAGLLLLLVRGLAGFFDRAAKSRRSEGGLDGAAVDEQAS